MKKVFVTTLVVAGALSIQTLQAQMSNPKITIEEQGKYLNGLFGKDNAESKAELLKEATLMVKSKNEDFVIMAGRVYGGLEESAKAEEINKLVLKKFPKGKKARGDAYEAAFSNKEMKASEMELAYQQWIKKFPVQSYAENDRGIFDFALGQVVTTYAKEGNVAKVQELMSTLANTNGFASTAANVGRELLKIKQNQAALSLLEEANKAAETSNPPARTKSMLSSLLGEALLANGQVDRAAGILATQYAEMPTGSTLIGLSSAYAQQGKALDAFLLLQDYVVKNGKTKELEEAMLPLYQKLNGQKGSFDTYMAGLDKQVKDALVAKYKSEMVKTEAPQFAVQDMDGNTVKLADLKGKVVVLDFWATWCGPCKISFPGMQSAVNKYAADKDVVFLFVNTWQSEANYQDLVRDFVKENNYTFQVVFDEMKDKAKSAVTAYGVKGIPTKVIIDKEGFIRFQSSGGSADVEKIVLEMETKIELARAAKV